MERLNAEQYTVDEMVERLTEPVVAIELAGEWVHAVTTDCNGKYHRRPLGDYDTEQEAEGAANKLADRFGVRIVRQTRPAQSITEVME